MPAVRMPLIQSAMALRTVSIQQSPSLAEVVDKGLEKIQEKNNVGQKLHKRTLPFVDGWIKTRLGARIFKKLQTAEGSFAAQAAVWNNRLRSR